MANAQVRSRRRTFLRVAAVSALLIAAACWAVGRWAVPALLVRQIEKVHRGRVVLHGWRLGWRSAALTGLVLSEGPAKTDPVWADIGRVEIDLGILDLVRGRRRPSRVEVSHPKLAFRIDPKGKPLTIPPFHFDGPNAADRFALPVVHVRNLDLAFLQEGRPPFRARGIQGRLLPDPNTNDRGGILNGTLDDSYWGKWAIVGRVDPGFKKGDFTLTGTCPTTTLTKCRSIPFVPKPVWTHINADGPMEASLFLAFDLDSKIAPVRTKTTVVSRGAILTLPNLNLRLDRSTGSATVEAGTVTFSALRGNALGGRLGGDGALTWVSEVPQLRLKLRLDRLDVALLREKWLPTAPRLAGRLVGEGDLSIAFAEGVTDLTGTSGSAEVAEALVEGVPIDRLRLSLSKDRSVGAHLAESPLIPNARIPGTLRARGVLNAIEAREAADRLSALGLVSFPPISGKLTVRFDAQAPFDGRLKRPSGFRVLADATLVEGSLFNRPIDRLAARFDLDRGVLAFRDVQGRLAPPNRRDPGSILAFVGFGSAGLDPRRDLVFHLETEPFSAEAVAVLTGDRPPPVEGNLSIDLNARADAARLSDPAAWNGNGVVRSARLASAERSGPKIVVDDLKTPVEIADGRLILPALTAKLEGEPATASLAVDLKDPFAFVADLDLPRRDLRVWLDRLGTADPADSLEIDGLLSARIESRGSLSPFVSTVAGSGLILGLRQKDNLVGDVPFRFELPETGRLLVRVVDAPTFGGVVSAEARVPIGRAENPPRGIDGKADLKNVDLHRLFALAPVERLPSISGRADGSIEFLIPARRDDDLPEPLPDPDRAGTTSSTFARLDRDDARINLILHSPDLKVAGTRAERIDATAWVRKRNVHYDLLARGWGGKVKLVGDARLRGEGIGNVGGVSARLQAVELDLARLCRAFEVDSFRPLSGTASLAAEMEARPADSAVWARGDVRLTDLRWGSFGSLGRLNGRFEYDPRSWRIDRLEGRLFDGVLSGGARDETNRRGVSSSRFEVNLDRADLAEALAFEPALAKRVKGFASLKLTGSRQDLIRCDGILTVPSATVYGIPLSSFAMPLEIETPFGSKIGAIRSRSLKTRIAGGTVRGDCLFRFGEDRSFRSKFELAALELETITRALSNGRRPASGRIQGVIAVEGRNSAQPRDYRGRVDLDLDDGRLFELPVLKDLGRLLGSKTGGVFNDGDLHATISNGELVVEQLTLQGRLLQLHVTGTVGFDQRLNLEVLVNTPELIPETGQALVSLIPGLGSALGRRQAAVAKVGGYLSNKLLKFRVGGTISNPSINTDPAVMVGEAAVGFFADVLKLPLNLLR